MLRPPSWAHFAEVVVNRPEVELVDDRDFGGPQQVQEKANCDVPVRPSEGDGEPVEKTRRLNRG